MPVAPAANYMRVKHDFYETPEWQTKALRRRVQVAGTVFECCVGDGSIARMFPDCKMVSNDIDPAREADFHQDATGESLWNEVSKPDWVVTNPPFTVAMPILRRAVEHARVGVIFLLRLSFMEPTRDRGPYLSATPPQRQIILPRWSYKQNGQTDCVTTAWFVWMKSPAPIEIVPLEEKEL